MREQLSLDSLPWIILNRLIDNLTQVVLLLFQGFRKVKVNLVFLFFLLLLFFSLLLPTISHELTEELFELSNKWILCRFYVAIID